MSLEIMICPGCWRPVKVLQTFFPSGKGRERVSLQKCPACGHEWSTSTPDEPAALPEFDPFTHGQS